MYHKHSKSLYNKAVAADGSMWYSEILLSIGRLKYHHVIVNVRSDNVSDAPPLLSFMADSSRVKVTMLLLIFVSCYPLSVASVSRKDL